MKTALIPITTLPATVLAVLALGSAASAAGEPWVYDLDQDGVYDTVAIDRWGDGVADYVGTDADQNGIAELLQLDLNNDSYLETTASDTNQNGYFEWIGIDGNADRTYDTIVIDSDENGVDDYSQWEFISGGVSTVGGPVTNPDWFYSHMMNMAAEFGPTFGTPDSDHDGWDDNHDWYPGDPSRY